MSLASKGHDQFNSFLILCYKIPQLLFQEFYCYNGRLLAQLKPFDISLLQQPLAPSALVGCHWRHGCLMPMSGFGLETTCRPSPLPSAPGTTSPASSSFIFHCPPLRTCHRSPWNFTRMPMAEFRCCCFCKPVILTRAPTSNPPCTSCTAPAKLSVRM